MGNLAAVRAIRIPKLSASNSDAEPWRMQRLNQIVGRLNSFSYNRYKYDLLAKLAQLHDENDALQITWSSKPSAAERAVTAHLWTEVSEVESAPVCHLSH